MSEEQLLKTECPICVISSGIVIEEREQHEANAQYSILFTLLGIVISDSAVQPEKAPSLRHSTPFPNVIVFKEEQPEKAHCPIFFTLSGMITVMSDKQS